MIIMGFFAGIFLATFSVASQTLFLQNFDPQKDLPIAIVVSGVFGLVVTIVYAYFQSRISYVKIILIFLTVMVALVVLLTLGYRYVANIKEIIYLSFIANGPFAAILLLIFWGTFNRLFTLKEAKEIIGNIDTGTLIASLISFFSIPVIVKMLSNNSDLFIISMGGLVIAFITLIVISRMYNLDKNIAVKADVKAGRYSYPKIFKDSYTRLLSIFIIVSMICVAFINFSFLNATSQQFPGEDEMAGFLAYFGGAVVILSFLFQTFFTDRIISMYGLKVALLIDPILLGILTIGSVIVGSIFGFSSNASNFILFFLVISMSQAILSMLNGSLDQPAFMLYFVPLPPAVKLDVQPKINGVITIFASLIAGGIISLFSNIKAFNLLTVVVAVIPLTVLWYWITVNMYKKYRETLKHTLETNKTTAKEKSEEGGGNHTILYEKVNEGKGPGTLFALNLMERIEPVLFEQSLQNLHNSGDRSIQNLIKKATSPKRSLNEINENPGEIAASETLKLALMALESEQESELVALDPKQLLRLAKSPNPEERIHVALVLRKILNEENTFILVELLRDVHPSVKIAAINTARLKKVASSWPFLVELLGSITYSHHAFAALVAMGEEVLPYLEKAFHRSGQTEEVMLKIARIYERIGGQQSIDLMWDKLDYPDKQLVTLILNSLHNNKYVVPHERMVKIRTLLENTLGYTLWNLAAIEELKEKPQNELIRQALQEEIHDNYERLYLLLGLMYDPQSVSLVRKNIELGSSETITFALELLDVFIDKEIRRLLFPVLDDISVDEKLEKLQDDFPRDRFDEIQVLKQILNRDFNQINQWTKACALYTLNQIEEFQVTDSIIAHLFNPDPLLSEMAAWLIQSKDENTYKRISMRIKREVRIELNEILASTQFKNELTDSLSLRFEKVLFLKSTNLFKDMPGYLLAEIVDSVNFRNYRTGEMIFSRLDNFPADLMVMAGGKAILTGPEGFRKELSKGDAIGEIMLPDMDASAIEGIMENKGSALLIGSGKLFDLMAKYEQITKILIASWEKIVSQPEVLIQA